MHTALKRQSVVGFLSLLLISAATSIAAAADTSASSEKEGALLAILQSDAPPAEKAITCKYLAIYGSSNSVSELAKLLSNEQLASWARIPLEVIPGPEADQALLKATDSLQGLLLVGTINSIGVRRVENATDQLTVLLRNPDAEVATAAAVALGRIGSEAASKSLREALTSAPVAVRSGVAEGCVLCAERFLSQDNAPAAAGLYDAVRTADVPRQRILEATRGAILARKEKGIALLMEQLQSQDKALFQIALSTAREFPGREVDQSLANELTRATPDRGALIVDAMADRSETVNLPAVLKAAKSGPKQVRVAAIAALGRVGNTTCLTTMLENALESDEDLVQTAKKALGEISGEAIDKEIVARLAKAEGKVYPVLLELIGQRRIDALAALQKALDHSDKAVRAAALTSLGATVPADKLSILIKPAVSAKNDEDAAVALTALKAACVRMPDREACAGELSVALERASVSTKIAMLKILASVGGSKAVQTIGTVAKANDPQLQDAGSDLLGKWMTADAAPYLLDLAKTSTNFQDRTMKGYIRIVKFAGTEPERVEMCLQAFDACRQVSQQKLVLGLLKQNPSIETLKLAIKCLQNAELKDDANQSTLIIAQKLGSNPEARELISHVELAKVKLEIIKAEYGSGAIQKEVTEMLQKQVTDSPLIALRSSNYNESFGGDPAPDQPKKLRIQYRMNDKAGDITFAEDALIVLPMPK